MVKGVIDVYERAVLRYLNVPSNTALHFCTSDFISDDFPHGVGALLILDNRDAHGAVFTVGSCIKCEFRLRSFFFARAS